VVHQPNSCLGRLIVEVSRSHTIRHTHTQPKGFPWTSDQLVAKAATYTTHNKHNTQTSMPQRYSNPRSQESNGFRPTP
jgi:hypothetical protein